MFSLYGCSMAQSGTGTEGAGGSWWLIVVYALLFAALYFFLIRPNSKKKKEEQKLRESITIGDDVTTIGGIVGKVVAVKEDEDAFIIETGSDRVKMKFKKWAISTVDSQKTSEKTEETKKRSFFSRKKDTKEETKK